MSKLVLRIPPAQEVEDDHVEDKYKIQQSQSPLMSFRHAAGISLLKFMGDPGLIVRG
jgi:hypothetical protein